MTGLFLFTLVFIIAQFFEKSDYDRMKEVEQDDNETFGGNNEQQ
jgi:hypothetical protein